jgi:hypothetical protein
MHRFLLIALTSTALLAQTDFNGTWVMNKAKSDFGQMPEQMVPEKLTLVITSSETKLKTVSTQVGSRGTGTAEANYTLDGKTPSVNKAMGGEISTIAKWDGKDITMASSREVQGMTLNIDQRLSKTGPDTILMTTKIGGTPMGDLVMKYHLERVATEAAAAQPAPVPVPEKAAASGTPNFVGTWKMNKAKSTFGQLPEEYQPTGATRIIQHDDKQASVKSAQTGPAGDLKMDFTLKLDGTESVVEGGKSVAKWEGPTLVVKSKRETQGMTLDITEKWVKVNDDQMNVETKIEGTPIGDILINYVFEKEK